MTTVAFRRQEALRRLALNDEVFVASILTRYSGVGFAGHAEPGDQVIDDRTRRLVDLAALIAVGGGPVGIDTAVNAALGAGASVDDVVEVLFSIAPAVGVGRVVSCAPYVAAAIGYDLESDFEEMHPAASEG